MSDPKIAVVISTFNEERYVERCLDAVAAQTIPCDVVVVDGGSTDRTVELLGARAASWPRLEIVDDGLRRSLPDALNVAIARTQRPFVAKVDARTFVARDFLARALDVFEREGNDVACVGGRPSQRGETPFGRGFAAARTSPFGVGGSGYADPRPHADVDTVQCGIYRRDDVLAVGGFDPALQFGEDEELNWRLRGAGRRIVRDTSIRFDYVTRPTFRSAFGQYRNYGRARTAVWRKHPGFMRPHHFVPSLAVVGFAALALGAVVSPRVRRAAVGVAAAYAGGATLAAMLACADEPASIPYAIAGFAALHAGYGVGMLEGLIAAYKSHRLRASLDHS